MTEIDDDLEIRLVRLERQITLVTRFVAVAISLAIAAMTEMIVARLTGSDLLGIIATMAALVLCGRLLSRELESIEEPFLRMLERQRVAEAAAFNLQEHHTLSRR
jgi:hypothetical protein